MSRISDFSSLFLLRGECLGIRKGSPFFKKRHAMDVSVFLGKRFAKSESLVSRRIGDEFLLVPIVRKAGEVEKVYVLNDTAAFVWELIDGDTGVAEIHDLMTAEYSVSSEEAEKDLLELLNDLSSIAALQEK